MQKSRQNRSILTAESAALAALSATALVTPISAQQAAPQNMQKPNIIVFLVDDMGWQDTSVPFWKETTPLNRQFRTPNMERLAAQGTVCTNAYACAICSPSRVSLMTGLNAARHRVTNWTLRFNQQTDATHPQLKSPLWNVNGISNTPETPRAVFAPTLPQKLREAGYHTIHIGKAHLGAIDTPGAEPKNLGFDVNVAGHAAGGPGSYLAKHNYSARWRNGGEVWDIPHLEKYHGSETFLTEALTREANAAVNEAVAAKKPFFLHLSHYAVHVPLEKDERFYGRYKDAGLDEKEATYAALVEGMDKSLGDVMDNLQKQGVAENTIIVFVSDNGGLSVHGRGGQRNTHNLPLRSGKGAVYEGGIRVPLIVKWSGAAQSGSRVDAPVIVEDIFPTLLAAANANVPANDGESILPLLRKANSPVTAVPERTLLWHQPNDWGNGPDFAYYSGLRRGDWKLIYFYADQRFELYNLRDDIGEQHNLARQQPERVKELATEMRRLLMERKAQMPLDKATGQPVPLPGL